MMPFQENEELQAAVESLWKVTSRLDRGDLLSWSDASAAMGFSHNTWQGRHVVNQVRKRLRVERSILCICEINTGVRLLTDREAAEIIPNLRQRKAYRQVNRCLREIESIDVRKLTTYQCKVLAQQGQNLRWQRLQIGRSRREFVRTMRTTKTLPRREVLEPVPVG